MKKLREKRARYIKWFAFALFAMIFTISALSAPDFKQFVFGSGAVATATVLSFINVPESTTVYGNTGIPRSKVNPEHFKAAVLLPKGTYLTDAECGALKTKLVALFKATPLSRAFPIGEITGFEDKSQKTVEGKTGYDDSRNITGTGKYNWLFHISNGLMYTNELRKFNDSGDYDVIFFDYVGNVWGTLYVAAGVTYFKGYGLSEIFVEDQMLGNGKDLSKGEISFRLKDASEFNANVAIIYASKADIKWDELKGLTNLNINILANITDYLTVGLTTAIDGVDLYPLHQGTLDETTAWIVKKVADGAALTVSAAAQDDAAGGWKLTLDYSGAVTVQLADCSVLEALSPPFGGYPGDSYESNIVTVTIAT